MLPPANGLSQKTKALHDVEAQPEEDEVNVSTVTPNALRHCLPRCTVHNNRREAAWQQGLQNRPFCSENLPVAVLFATVDTVCYMEVCKHCLMPIQFYPQSRCDGQTIDSPGSKPFRRKISHHGRNQQYHEPQPTEFLGLPSASSRSCRQNGLSS